MNTNQPVIEVYSQRASILRALGLNFLTIFVILYPKNLPVWLFYALMSCMLVLSCLYVWDQSAAYRYEDDKGVKVTGINIELNGYLGASILVVFLAVVRYI